MGYQLWRNRKKMNKKMDKFYYHLKKDANDDFAYNAAYSKSVGEFAYNVNE